MSASPDDLGTAVNVQAMVFGNRDERSGTGVGFTRDPATGAKGEYGDFLVNAQGEDVVAGIRNTEPLSEMKRQFPAIHKELMAIFARLEHHYRDMCDTEFTIEQGKLWMLQTRVGKRTGRAALKMAVDMTKERSIALSHEEAVARVTAEHIDQVLHPQFSAGGHKILTKGLAASPGAAVGQRVLHRGRRRERRRIEARTSILVRSETSPEDVHGMLASKGILTARGGLVSHAAVVARGLGQAGGRRGRGCQDRRPHLQGRGRPWYAKGEWISPRRDDGPGGRRQGLPHPGRAPAELEMILGWADSVREGVMKVRAERRHGRRRGKCEESRGGRDRLVQDRAHVPRRGPAAGCEADDPRRSDEEEEDCALEELRSVQKEDFVVDPGGDGRTAGHGQAARPAASRIPSRHDRACCERSDGGLSEEERTLYRAALEWREANPMLGTRGVRLGVIKPGLYAMQVRALMEAAVDRVKSVGTR